MRSNGRWKVRGVARDQVPVALNSYINYTRAYSLFAVKVFTDALLPQNGGVIRPIHVRAREGSFFNPREPAPSGGRAIIQIRIFEVINGALAQALPGFMFYAFGVWHGSHVLREAKPVVPSAWAWASETPAAPRLTELLASPNRCPDPTQQIRDAWIVRRLAPDASKIELGDLTGDHVGGIDAPLRQRQFHMISG